MNTTLHVLRVFTNEAEEHGNPLGICLDGAAVPPEQRQAVAAELGFSETVFVDDLETGGLRIFTPATEVAFAGHPIVGTAWLMARGGAAPAVLRPPVGEVPVRIEGEMTWISGRPEWAPGAEHVQLANAAEVEALEPIESGDVFYWAWIDKPSGAIRARCFAPDVGIVEDEATGSAVLKLCGEVGRPVRVEQGVGSWLEARPLPGGMVEVGGRVVLDQERELSVG